MTSSRSRCPRVLLVIGHGRETSFCHFLLGLIRDQLTKGGFDHRVHDLLADGFDPILRLTAGQEQAGRVVADDDPIAARYQDDVLWADAFVIVHPVWWFAPPAILKGWVDRVFADGVALHQPVGGGPPEGTLGGRKALVVQTFNADRAVDKVVFGGISKRFWWRAVFFPAGIDKISYFAIYSVNTLDAGKLKRTQQRLRRTLSAFLASF